MPFVSDVLQQHADSAAAIHSCRSGLVSAPHVDLHDLGAFDEQLTAHLDGLFVAGEHAWLYCDEALETSSRGSVFVAAVNAIQQRRAERLERLYALSEAVPDARSGLLAALGWVASDQLRGLVAALLSCDNPFRRSLAISVCGLHRVDPGVVSGRRLQDPSAAVRARALRTTGELGCVTLARCAPLRRRIRTRTAVSGVHGPPFCWPRAMVHSPFSPT